MPQDVLTVARAVVQSPEVVDDALVEAADARFLYRLFAVTAYLLLDFLLGFGNELFDARRMNPAIGNELVKGDLGDFAAHGVERANDHHAWRVVDDHIHSGGLLERADISPFAADDAALHFVAGNIDRAGR